MWGWIGRLFGHFGTLAHAPLGYARDGYGRRLLRLRPHGRLSVEPPKMQWSHCHPSTARVFKASMTCPNGHTLTLRNHSISQEGNVSPSVVCPGTGCGFHEWVRLDGWN